MFFLGKKTQNFEGRGKKLLLFRKTEVELLGRGRVYDLRLVALRWRPLSRVGGLGALLANNAPPARQLIF